MTDTMEALFNYAQEHLVRPLLSQERKYTSTHLCVQKQEEAFRALLNGREQERFDELMDEHNLLTSFYGRAVFRAGFQIAMELSR